MKPSYIQTQELNILIWKLRRNSLIFVGQYISNFVKFHTISFFKYTIRQIHYLHRIIQECAFASIPCVDNINKKNWIINYIKSSMSSSTIFITKLVRLDCAECLRKTARVHAPQGLQPLVCCQLQGISNKLKNI